MVDTDNIQIVEEWDFSNASGRFSLALGVDDKGKDFSLCFMCNKPVYVFNEAVLQKNFKELIVSGLSNKFPKDLPGPHVMLDPMVIHCFLDDAIPDLLLNRIDLTIGEKPIEEESHYITYKSEEPFVVVSDVIRLIEEQRGGVVDVDDYEEVSENDVIEVDDDKRENDGNQEDNDDKENDNNICLKHKCKQNCHCKRQSMDMESTPESEYDELDSDERFECIDECCEYDGEEEDDNECEDCSDCVDCSNCIDCHGCVNCVGCVGCVNCNGCVDCGECVNCSNCSESFRLKNCDSCDTCNNCLNSEDLELCMNCKSCTDLYQSQNKVNKHGRE